MLVAGQRIRYTFSILAGALQTFLLNGKSTNREGCPIAIDECWSWGLTINQYYAVLFCIVAALFVPVCYLKEPDPRLIPRHSFRAFMTEMWLTLQNLTTFYLIVFVIGIHTLTNFTNNVNVFLQYYVIGLTSLQVGGCYNCGGWTPSCLLFMLCQNNCTAGWNILLVVFFSQLIRWA